ncbi:MAG: hypothetical protein QOF13_2244 [Solirubrobacterales bacterium]|jgi:hypothetical protein|nr:hypothetical protein [Solirubrobacterales bacterium]
MAIVRESPLSLKLSAILFLAAFWGPVAVNHGSAPLSTYLGAFALTLAPLIFVLRGSRIAWIVSVALMAASVVGVLVNGTLWETLIRAAPLVLLLVPESPRYIWGR